MESWWLLWEYHSKSQVVLGRVGIFYYFFFSLLCFELTLCLVLILLREVSLFCTLLPFSAVGVIWVEQ